MVTTRPPKTIVKPTALGPVANTDTKLLIYGLFQKAEFWHRTGSAFCENRPLCPNPTTNPSVRHFRTTFHRCVFAKAPLLVRL